MATDPDHDAGMSDQPVQSPPIFPPPWFVANFNAGVMRDWGGTGIPPYRGALDPLVMFSWHLATENLRRPMTFVAGLSSL